MQPRRVFERAMENIRKEDPDSWSLADDVGKFAFGLAPQINVDKSDMPGLVAAILFARIATSHEACLTLLERGMQADARTVMRSAVETTIHLGALCAGIDTIPQLISEHYRHERTRREAMLRDENARRLFSEEQLKAVQSIIDDARAQQGTTLPSLEQLAIKGGEALLALYNTCYRGASGDAAHVMLDSLNRHVVAAPDGDITGIAFGPERASSKGTLLDVINTLVLALYLAEQKFSLSVAKPQMDLLRLRWEALVSPRA